MDAATHNTCIAVDVGANDGWYATYYALQLNIQRVYAFEPDDHFHEPFHQNCSLNGPDAKRKCAIVSKFVGTVDDAETCRLDTVLADESQPVMMKIDVEGAELDVLRGADLRWLSCGLVIETNGANLERDCQELLQGLRYRTWIVKNGSYRAIIPEHRDLPHNRLAHRP